MKKKLMIFAILAVVIIIAVAFVFVVKGKSSEKTEIISADEASKIAIDFINKYMLGEGLSASLLEILDENGVYRFKIDIDGQEYESYITKDGKILFATGIDITEVNNTDNEANGNSTGEVPKQDRPDVKLFVMSYCPYGLQAQKMFLPVYDLLKDKADIGVYFVSYIMHGKDEIDENLNQYCIQKEEPEKYGAYLSCFVAEGDYKKCASQAGINTAKIQNCFFDTDKEFDVTVLYNDESTWLSGVYPPFNVHADLNNLYGVQGSPTVVINGTVVSVSPRSPENFKNIICQAFNSSPDECSQALSSESPSAGFGGGTSETSNGGCGQ